MREPCKRFGCPRIRLLRIPKGRPGTLITARMIADMIRGGAKDFCVRQTAIRIFRQYGIPGKDRMGEVCAILDWVKKNIRFTRDIFRVETLHTPRRMLELRAGDCDDFTILLGSLLMSTGHPIRLALVGFRPNKPHRYSHIYPEVNVKGRWLAIDGTANWPLGWAPPALWKRICAIEKEDLKCSPKIR